MSLYLPIDVTPMHLNRLDSSSQPPHLHNTNIIEAALPKTTHDCTCSRTATTLNQRHDATRHRLHGRRNKHRTPAHHNMCCANEIEPNAIPQPRTL